MSLTLKSLFAATLILVCSASQEARPPGETAAGTGARPNILFIMADDLGYECLGCDGGLDYRTPHLDALATGGMRFENAYSNPICTPTRVQVMTGRYTQRNYDCFGYLRPSELTFGNVMREAGYATCIAGKWQLSGDAQTVRDFGFDAHCLWNMHSYRKDASGRAASEPKGWLRRYERPMLFVNGEWSEQGKGQYGPRVCLEFILEFIAQPREAPFFVYYPMILPHAPMSPTPDSADPRSKDRRSNFTDMVQYMDRIVGELIAGLEKLGLREDTLVIFTGDNGTSTAIATRTAGGLVQGAKANTIDAGTHVPLIAAWPARIEAGQVSSALVDFSDFLPTFAELGHAPLPNDRVFDGYSLMPHLLGAAHRREWVFCHYPSKGRKMDIITRFARDRRWKLYGDGRFYDVMAEPLEKALWSAPQPGSSQKAAATAVQGETARVRLQQVLDGMLER